MTIYLFYLYIPWLQLAQMEPAQGAMFTLVSDGVVEAENAQREISGKSALEITEAAKAWGQTDDITVVTVERSTACA